jgi:pimeloyl-ACP methyl ester carboxylesterase
MKALRIEAAGRATAVGMYLHESGTPGSPAVVFLHGAGASGRMWREHMARLAGFHCLAPDLPGFGRSNHLPSASRIETADLVAELIKTRVPAGRASIVGLSWGGGVAHTLLDRHPELVDRVVIDGAGVLSWWANGPFLLGIAAIAPFLHTRPVTAFFGDIIGMDEVGREDLRASSRRAFRRAFVEGFRSGVSHVEIAATCPTLLVAGENETVVRKSNAAQAALMPHAVARFAPGLGHGWVARRMELHVRMVEAWLTGQELPAELPPEPSSPASVERLLRELGKEAPGADHRLDARPR